jgi:hypothetical protein
MDFMDKDQFYKFVCEIYLRQSREKARIDYEKKYNEYLQKQEQAAKAEFEEYEEDE